VETNLHVIELGGGEPIVFVHGAFDSGERPSRSSVSWADRYKLVLVDRRGYGDSPPAPRFDFDSQVDDLTAVLDRGGTSGRLAVRRRPLPAGRRRPS
jgi:pimeloyl-ACP methyl ester carboxylesterase